MYAVVLSIMILHGRVDEAKAMLVAVLRGDDKQSCWKGTITTKEV